MKSWQITEPKSIQLIKRKEQSAQLGEVKIKTTKTMIAEEDVAIFTGEDKVQFPVVLGRFSVGVVVESPENIYGIERNAKVYIEPNSPCGACYHCTIGQPKDCSQLVIAGKNSEGFLSDFVIVPSGNVYPLPKSVSESQAIYVGYISLAVSVIDKLKIQRGEHVAVIGGNVFANILSQLIIYYQAVPIFIDDNDANLQVASKSGIYYTLRVDNRLEKEVSELTGGRMASKVVYVTNSLINSDIAIKLASPNGEIAFAGLNYSSIRVNFALAMQKQIKVYCINNGYGNTEASINIIANHAVNLENIKSETINFNDVAKHLKDSALKREKEEEINNVIVDMLN